MSVFEDMEQAGVTREQLGREVRRVWIGWASGQQDPKPSWLVPYDELGAEDQEADNRIGQVLWHMGWRAAQERPRSQEDAASAEDDNRTPFQIDRDNAEAIGTWPESWGPYHRHFASDAIHRDGGPECDQPGTPRRVYVFDPDFLEEHERAVARWAAAQGGSQ